MFIKVAFKKKSRDEQVSWFVGQKRKREVAGKNAVYQFEELVATEKEVKSSGTDMAKQVLWSDWQMFKEAEMSKAEIKGDLDVANEEEVEFFCEELKGKWEAVLRTSKLVKKIEDV